MTESVTHGTQALRHGRDALRMCYDLDHLFGIMLSKLVMTTLISFKVVS